MSVHHGYHRPCVLFRIQQQRTTSGSRKLQRCVTVLHLRQQVVNPAELRPFFASIVNFLHVGAALRAGINGSGKRANQASLSREENWTCNFRDPIPRCSSSTFGTPFLADPAELGPSSPSSCQKLKSRKCRNRSFRRLVTFTTFVGIGSFSRDSWSESDGRARIKGIKDWIAGFCRTEPLLQESGISQ